MKKTLEQYIEPQNIPKKYGGQLDYKFGDLPVLEPIIEQSLKWREPAARGAHKTFPTGPIKWQYDEAGDLVAVAVGSENGKQRNKAIASLHSSGVAQLALTPGRVANPREAFYRTTTGNATHPPTPTDAVTDRQAGNSNASNIPADIPTGPTPMTSRAGATQVPYRDSAGPTTADSQPRQGTSATRFEQQQYTHAAGQLADGTPAQRETVKGDKVAVMEPKTVGQAPKEHDVPQPEGSEPAAPSYIDQAKGLVGQMEQTVLSAVGYGGKEEPAAPVEEEKKEDPAVDAMDSKDVEEFLRSRVVKH